VFDVFLGCVECLLGIVCVLFWKSIVGIWVPFRHMLWASCGSVFDVIRVWPYLGRVSMCLFSACCRVLDSSAISEQTYWIRLGCFVDLSYVLPWHGLKQVQLVQKLFRDLFLSTSICFLICFGDDCLGHPWAFLGHDWRMICLSFSLMWPSLEFVFSMSLFCSGHILDVTCSQFFFWFVSD